VILFDIPKIYNQENSELLLIKEGLIALLHDLMGFCLIE
jgi:hypothetical protein